MPAMSPSREDIIHTAMIRAAFCVSRSLSLSQACTPPGCRICGAIDAPACEQCAGPFSADEAQRLVVLATPEAGKGVSMSPDEFDAWQQREQAHQRRDAIIHAAAIRAALYAARSLPPATGCAAAMSGPALCTSSSPAAQGPVCAPPVRECQMCGATDPAHRAVCEQLHPGVCEWLPADDTEGCDE